MTSHDRFPAPTDPQAEELDADIVSIRAEIQKLQRRKRFLASSLLASDPIQKLLRKPTTSFHDEPTLRLEPPSNSIRRNSISIQRPSPTAPKENLLGIRIDVCTRGGRFAKPYYLLLKRERARGDPEKRFKVHRHTVPAFISLAKLQSVYLPFPGSGHDREGQEDSETDDVELSKASQRAKGARKQDLHAFVRELRRELVAWHLRSDAVELLREKLGLSEAESEAAAVQRLSPESKAGVISVTATAVEARYVRVEWEDGRVGRFKLTNSGIVERAVVIGDKGGVKQTEDAMTGGGGRVETLLDRLKEHDG
ncbi:hypothetical protein N7468_009347 [Penicillium chermesinum]|uniref:Centromere protein Cenp-O n=1 Tax=Penicillium chermesinum TaxID=63820 RepID=A0A9W9TEX2_9EURO|nr:uncharacterized protein N7468_009347 [Penicillium chermesinum]KAJ5220143.1 hypothetical protein N7468_009347 [Penicillium chermesinum]